MPVGTPRTKTGKSKKKAELEHVSVFIQSISMKILHAPASSWLLLCQCGQADTLRSAFWRIVTHVLNRRTQIAGQLERFSVFHVAPSYRKNFLSSYLKCGITFAARGAWGGVIRRTFKHVIFSMIIKQKLTHLFIGVHNTSTSHDSQFSRGF